LLASRRRYVDDGARAVRLARLGSAIFCAILRAMTPVSLGADRMVGDRYALEALIGRGGMGEVWRARHVALDTRVAVKFLRGAAEPSDRARRRFLTEARVTATLKTRYAVQVFDFGVTDDGLPYLVMELLEGDTLDKRIARE
jgi:eukaryotic-like serine/threonine-protein kinase